MVQANVVFMWIKQADSLQNLITALKVVRKCEESGTLDKTAIQERIMKEIRAKEKRAAQDYLALGMITGAVKEDVAKIIHLTPYGKSILNAKNPLELIGKALSSYGPFVWFLRNIEDRSSLKHGEDVAIIGLGSQTNKEHSIDVIRRRRDSFRSWANSLGLIEVRHDGIIRKADKLEEFLKDSEKGTMQVHSKYIYNPLNAEDLYGVSGSEVSVRRSVILSILQEHGSIAWSMLESTISSLFEYPRLSFKDDVLALQSCGLVDREDQTIKKFMNSTGAATFGKYVIVGRAEWRQFKEKMKQVCRKLNLQIPEYVLGEEEEEVVEEEEIIGEPMQLGVMNYAPTNELGVVAVFVTYRKELGFPTLEVIRPQFPDAIALLKLGNKYVRKYIEFEFKSSGFKKHLSEKKKCHYVVCWEHNWKNCPIPVIELRTRIKEILKLKDN
jgi:hypothetical protein